MGLFEIGLIRRVPLNLFAVSLAAVLCVCSVVHAQDDVELRELGTVEIATIQIALLWSGSLGGGTRHFNGESHAFTLGGAGLGGFGGSSLNASGRIYNLNILDQFEGAYSQVRTGFVAGTEGNSKFWLENETGMYIELEGD